MTKERWLGLIRTVLSIVGAFLVGKNFLGNPVDESLLAGIVGAVMSLVALVWSVVDKSATIEAWQSGIRQAVLFFGGLLVASGKLKVENLETIAGLGSIIAMYVYGLLSRAKSKKIDQGTIKVEDLKK